MAELKTVTATEAPKWSLQAKDWFKGLGIAVGTAVLTGVYACLTAIPPQLTLQAMQPALIAGAGAGVAYILKNWSENSKGQVFRSEPKE